MSSFLFRLIGAIVAVVFSSLVMLLVGTFNGWVLTTPLLGLHFVLIAIVVLLAEHFRSRAYERLIATDAPWPTLEDIRPWSETAAPGQRSEQRLISRAMDVVVAVVLVIVMAPVMVLIALLIRTDSSGPALFRSRRIGKGGKPFTLLKFRTMASISRANDPDLRTTRVGRFLRQAKLDELPTVLNVLIGDMTFVGPRPESVQLRETLRDEIADRLLAVKPGIIGLATPVYRPGSEEWQSTVLAEIQFAERATARQKFKLLARFALDAFRVAGAV